MKTSDAFIAMFLVAGFLLVVGGVWAASNGALASIVAGLLLFWLGNTLAGDEDETATVRSPVVADRD